MRTCGRHQQRKNTPLLERVIPFYTQKRQTRRQVKALEANVLTTLKGLAAAYPDHHRSQEILSRHQRRVQAIVHPVRKVPKPRRVYVSRETCDICHKLIVYPVNYWTDSLLLQLLWSCFVTGLFFLIAYFLGWWALPVPLVAWAISFSFLWSITVPTIMFLSVIFILESLFGL